MKAKEKRIIANHSLRNEKVLKWQRSHALEDPYTSERHDEAVRYIQDNDLTIKALRLIRRQSDE